MGGSSELSPPASQLDLFTAAYPSLRLHPRLSHLQHPTPSHLHSTCLDVMPDGNIVGTFPGRDCVVEVASDASDVVWELCARGSSRNSSKSQDGSLFALESTRLLRFASCGVGSAVSRRCSRCVRQVVAATAALWAGEADYSQCASHFFSRVYPVYPKPFPHVYSRPPPSARVSQCTTHFPHSWCHSC